MYEVLFTIGSLPLCQHMFDFIDGHAKLSYNVIRSSEETQRDFNLSHSSSDTAFSEIETQTSTPTPVKSKEIETQDQTPSQVKSPDIEINNKCTSVIQEPDYVQNVKRANLNDSRGMGFPTMWYVRQAKPQISLRI